MWHESCGHIIRPVDTCRSPGWVCICALVIILYRVDAAQPAGSNVAAVKIPSLSPPPQFRDRLASILQSSVASGHISNEGLFTDESCWTPRLDIPKSSAIEHRLPMTNTHDPIKGRNPVKLLLSALLRLAHHPKYHRHDSEGKTSQTQPNLYSSLNTNPFSYTTLPRAANRLGIQDISDGTQQRPQELDQQSKEPVQPLTSSNVVCNGQVRTVEPENHYENVVKEKAQSSPSPRRSRFSLVRRESASDARRSASTSERDAVRFRPGLRQMPRVSVSDPSAGQPQSHRSTSSPASFRENSRNTSLTLLEASSSDSHVSKRFGSSAIVDTPPDSRQLIPANIRGSPSRRIPLVPPYSASIPLPEEVVSNPGVNVEEEGATGASGVYHSASSPSGMKARRKLKQPANSVVTAVESSVVALLIPTALGGELPLASDSATQLRKLPSHVNSGGLTSPGIPRLTNKCSSTTLQQEYMPVAHGGSPPSSSGVQGQCTEVKDVPKKTYPHVKTQSSPLRQARCRQPTDVHLLRLVPSATPDKSGLDNVSGEFDNAVYRQAP